MTHVTWRTGSGYAPLPSLSPLRHIEQTLQYIMTAHLAGGDTVAALLRGLSGEGGFDGVQRDSTSSATLHPGPSGELAWRHRAQR